MKNSYLAALVSMSFFLNSPSGMCRTINFTLHQPSYPSVMAEAAQNQTKKASPPIVADPAKASPDLDAQAQKIKRSVQKIGVGGKITVILKNGNERHGTLAQMNEQELQMVEVDLKQQMTIGYAEIKKVREGYGNVSPVTGKRLNPNWGKIAVIGVVVFVVVAAALVGKNIH